jgi:divalent metal cation (Fe/Co/Zn/Cd) transporter
MVKETIDADKYIAESGVQGGKILGEKIVLFSFIVGIPLLIIGLYGLISILFDLGFPNNMATIILALVVFIIGFLLTIGGYNIYRTKNVKH